MCLKITEFPQFFCPTLSTHRLQGFFSFVKIYRFFPLIKIMACSRNHFLRMTTVRDYQYHGTVLGHQNLQNSAETKMCSLSADEGRERLCDANWCHVLRTICWGHHFQQFPNRRNCSSLFRRLGFAEIKQFTKEEKTHTPNSLVRELPRSVRSSYASNLSRVQLFFFYNLISTTSLAAELWAKFMPLMQTLPLFQRFSGGLTFPDFRDQALVQLRHLLNLEGWHAQSYTGNENWKTQRLALSLLTIGINTHEETSDKCKKYSCALVAFDSIKYSGTNILQFIEYIDRTVIKKYIERSLTIYW